MMSAVVGLNAQAFTALTLTLTDGGTFSYALDDKPDITFQDDQMLISVKNASAQYNMSEVVDMTFTEVNAVDEIAADSSSVLAYRDGVLQSPGHEITVYTLSGAIVSRAFQTLPTDNLAPAIYLVRAGQQSLKIIK